MRLVLRLVFPVLCSLRLAGQSPTLPLQHPGHHLLDRLDILDGGNSPIHPEIRPFTRRDAVQYAFSLEARDSAIGPRSRQDLQYLFDDNTEWMIMSGHETPDSVRCRQARKPILGIFYRRPGSLFEVNTPSFLLRVNPLLNIAAGPERAASGLVFFNQRGLELRGTVDGRLFFYTNILETQARFPDYVQNRIAEFQAIPGAGFYKPYTSKFFKINNGYDFNLAQAYVGADLSRHISVQLGHGTHFIGNGYRSLFLSDAGNYAYYLKLSTRVWKLHYQNLFLELSPVSTAVPRPPNSILPKKYAAVHYLNFRPRPNLAFGFFEATVFNRSRQFELQYLNPVILYRTVEGSLGSPDNVLIGLDGRWNFLHRFQVYGQLLLDEFLFSAVYKPEQKGWWGNKFGLQAGLKYINAFGVDHLDLQLEFNSVRPYTYSSFDSLNSYTHYHQPLAHPLWANFREIIGIARYQPHRRLSFMARFIQVDLGENSDTENWGANPLLSNSNRVAEYGNTTGQGVGARIALAGLDASWQLFHNLYLDLNLFWRRKDSQDDQRDQTTILLLGGIRWNVWGPRLDF